MIAIIVGGTRYTEISAGDTFMKETGTTVYLALDKQSYACMVGKRWAGANNIPCVSLKTGRLYDFPQNETRLVKVKVKGLNSEKDILFERAD